ncbi:hypothetical protein ACFY4K_33165 [Streptomyces leeuwenhoekii]|uniref:hypothetical protein n=1 Tax=Streptomyces leeuwenhoekii TaxID=1437453 RepID=UPI0036AAFC03
MAAVKHTTHLARLLEARAAALVVHLRDDHKQSWRTIAKAIHGDPEMHSTVRRQCDAGRRHSSLCGAAAELDPVLKGFEHGFGES